MSEFDIYNLNDPSSQDPSVNPFYSSEFSNAPDTGSAPALGMGSTPGVDAFYSNDFPQSTGGASTRSPVQGSGSGSSFLGWLGLANNVTKTVTDATRTGYTTRPGVTQKQTSSLGSFSAVTTTTLLVIVAVFVGVLFLLRK